MTTPSRGLARLVLFALLSGGLAAAATAADAGAAGGDDRAYRSYLAHVAAAAGALRLHDTPEAHRWLDRAPAAYRGWEWRYLAGRASQELASWRAHEGSVTVLAYAPDGARLATAARDGTVKVWDAESWALLATLGGHEGTVWAVAWSPDGRRLASASAQGVVRLWELPPGAEPGAGAQPLWVREGAGAGVSGLAFDPAGGRLAYASWLRSEERSVYGVVRVLSPATGADLLYLEHADKPLRAVAWSPDGHRLAAGSWGATVAVWTFPEGGGAPGEPRVLEPPPTGGYQAVDAVAFSADGSGLAVGAKDGTVRRWDPAGGELVWSAGDRGEGHQRWVNGLAFLAGGEAGEEALATVSSDSTVRLWDAASGRPAAVLLGHDSAVDSVAAAPDGRRLATGGSDGTVKLWDPWAAAGPATLWSHPESVYGIGFDAAGERAATASFGGTVKLWEVATGRELAEIALYDEEDEAMDGAAGLAATFTPDGRLLTSDNHGRLRHWDLAGGAPPVTLEDVGEQSQLAIVLSPDGRRMVAPSAAGTAKVWDLASAEAVSTLIGHERPVYDVAWSRDGRWIATAGLDGTAKLWDAATGAEVAAIAAGGAVRAVAFSPDGRLLAAAAGTEVGIWAVPSGAPVRTLAGHQEGVQGVSFHPDGSRLVSASSDFTVRLWDAATGENVLTLPFAGAVWDALFHPDGERLFVLPMDGTVRVLRP